MLDDEWHEHDRERRRAKVLFKLAKPNVILNEHSSIKHIAMLDEMSGVIVLKDRRKREFFTTLLPNARFFLLHQHALPDCAPAADWCESIRPLLLNKLAKQSCSNVHGRRLSRFV